MTFINLFIYFVYLNYCSKIVVGCVIIPTEFVNRVPFDVSVNLEVSNEVEYLTSIRP